MRLFFFSILLLFTVSFSVPSSKTRLSNWIKVEREKYDLEVDEEENHPRWEDEQLFKYQGEEEQKSKAFKRIVRLMAKKALKDVVDCGGNVSDLLQMKEYHMGKYSDLSIEYYPIQPEDNLVAHIDIDQYYAISSVPCEFDEDWLQRRFADDKYKIFDDYFNLGKGNPIPEVAANRVKRHYSKKIDDQYMRTSIYSQNDHFWFPANALIFERFEIRIKIYPLLFYNRFFYLHAENDYATSPEEAVYYIILHELGHLEYFLHHYSVVRNKNITLNSQSYYHNLFKNWTSGSEASCDQFAASVMRCNW